MPGLEERKIKFRAWDKKNKRWYKTELEFYGFALFGECTLICPPRVKDLINLEISQFTGLKDKNGKEIYEGDIVELKGNFNSELYQEVENNYDLSEKGLFEIIWNQDCAMWDIEFAQRDECLDGDRIGEFGNSILNDYLVDYLDEFEGEVIGNIYENPEFCKGYVKNRKKTLCQNLNTI